MKHRSLRILRTITVIAAAAACGCQTPTSSSSNLDVDDIVTSTAAPQTAVATTSSGRTYRVVRGNNQPDDILPYDWHTVFSASIVFNSKATDDDLDIDFPVKLSSTTLAVKQASAGIITPPTGADKEYYDFVTLGASSNQVSGVNAPVTLTFEVWYDLPSLRREAVVTIQFQFVDKDNATFTKAVDFNVAP